MKKVIIFLLAALGLMITGCGKAGESASEDKVLKFILADDTLEGGPFAEVAKLFEEENPGVRIEIIELPYGDIMTRVRNMISGRDVPALVKTTEPERLSSYALKLDKNLTDKFLDVKIPLSVDPQTGEFHSMPMNSTVNGMIVNKTLFDKAGIDVPEEVLTWDEFESLIVDVKEGSGATYSLVWDKSPSRVTTLMYHYGASVFNEDLTKATLNSEEAVAALTRFSDMHKSGVIPRSVWVGNEDANAFFKSGSVVAYMSGSWRLNEYNDTLDSFEWQVVKMPMEAKRSSIVGGNSIVALKGSGVEEETLEFLEFLSREDIYPVFLRTGGYLPALKGFEDIEFNFRSEDFRSFADEAAHTDSTPSRDWANQKVLIKVVNHEFRFALEDIAAGSDVRETLNELNEAVQKVIDEN